MPRTQPNHLDMLDQRDIFDAIYKARCRFSLYELEHCMSEVEQLPLGNDADQQPHAALRALLRDALTDCEQRLAALQARYAALPELPGATKVEAI